MVLRAAQDRQYAPPMRMPVSRSCRVAGVAIVTMAAVALPAGSALGATAPAWKAGACFARAEIQNDFVDLTSAVPCEQPHTVQSVGGAALPAALAQYSLAQLRDTANVSVRTALGVLADEACSGKAIASGIWPKQGAAIARVLTGLAATAAGGVLPGLGDGMNFGWVLPDAAAFDGGDRSMVCVVYKADPKSDGSVAAVRGLTGDLQLLGSSDTVASLRHCTKYQAAAKRNLTVSCAKPHRDEVIAFFAGSLPVDVAKMTEAQWAPYDAQCRAITDVLVGAKRSDLTVVANPDAEAKAKTQIYVPCFVSRVAPAKGSQPNLPPGSVVGLGTRHLAKG